MRLFKWSTTYLIHIPELDQEHKELFLSADELHRGLLEGESPDRCRPALKNILKHASDHFSHEEDMMRAAHYSSFAWHKRQHDTARARVATLARRIRRGDRDAVLDLLQFLAPWLKDHISVADKMMAACLRNEQRARLAS